MGVKAFIEGGISAIVGASLSHPLDLIKVWMQLHGESGSPVIQRASAPSRVGLVAVGIRIVQQDGVRALFSGMSATVLRQGLYSSTRMGVYDILKQKWTDPRTGYMPLTSKIGAGLIAGAVGAAVCNPADLAMVRMQADGRLPSAQRRNYKSVIDAISRMGRSEGITSLWRGSLLAVSRAMLLTASKLASYDQFKETIITRGLMKDGLGTQVTASFTAGFVVAVVSNPVDVIKTRVMNMKVGAERPLYAGPLDCAMKTVRMEGPMALYKGFIPTLSRQGPFTVVLFVTLEQVRKLLKDF